MNPEESLQTMQSAISLLLSIERPDLDTIENVNFIIESEQTLREMIADRLGDFDFDKINEVLAINLNFKLRQVALVTDVENETITFKQYMDQFTKEIEKFAKGIGEVIGPDNFLKIFDLPVEDAAGIVDPLGLHKTEEK